MKHPIWRRTVQIVLFLSLLVQILPVSLAAEAALAQPDTSEPPAESDAPARYTQVELYSGEKALDTANLENYVSGGMGYRFGYYDEARGFVELGRTEQTTISMLKTHNIYFDKNMYYTVLSTEYGAVGCHHVQMPGSYSDFASAKAAAEAAGGFVAWISGTYYVRVGNFTSAAAAAEEAGRYAGATVGETSRYGISVTITKTDTILFQFDDEGRGTGLGVEPDITGAEDRQTWFKGRLYYGGFRYQRAEGNKLTVVNMLEQEVPNDPEIPEDPETPETPETPGDPETPEIPETPEEPETPEIPETPGDPETPEIPETPGDPETPETPETPGNSETPEIPETPEEPEIPETPETPENPEPPEIPATQEQQVRVGLFYGNNALDTANLENYSGCGAGYRFGYYNGDLQFMQLGYTEQTKVSILKTHNIYLAKDKTYTTSATDYGAVGCYHVQLPGSWDSFESARKAADSVGGFVAWIGGVYYVRLGSYVSAGQAAAAAAERPGASVGETTRYGISVTVTGTTTILFQFDDEGKGTGLGVEPDITGAEDRQAWFKGYRYRGGLRYQRADGNKLTVVNVVGVEDYVKGVVPYEMSPSWPLEALKSQAVCARTYVLCHLNKHRTYGFDVCTGQECQVYNGVNRENDATAQAVDETEGLTIKYNGKYIDAVFSSSDGGASESSKNVWGTDFPYLQGVVDPFEATVADNISNYSWTRTLTGVQLQERLIGRGYTRCGVITAVSITKTDMGNVYSMTFQDEYGKSYTIYRETCRTALGMRSQRFDLAGGATQEEDVYVNGEQVSSAQGLYAVDAAGNQTQLGSTYTILTANGVETVAGGGGEVAAKNGSFTFQGTGYGHNVGLSQWGANAMAKLGYGYEDILTFYYTGVTIEP